jgi:hypothetical protein
MGNDSDNSQETIVSVIGYGVALTWSVSEWDNSPLFISQCALHELIAACLPLPKLLPNFCMILTHFFIFLRLTLNIFLKVLGLQKLL